MAVNRGKKFEYVIREAFERVPGVSLDRLNDNTAGFKGIAGICDFIVYKYPFEYYIECKAVHGNTLSIHSNDLKHRYGLITNKQYEGLLEKSSVKGVVAGIMCWWIDKNTTKFIPIQVIRNFHEVGMKSIRWDESDPRVILLTGRKKTVFWDYNMKMFFNEVEARGIHEAELERNSRFRH